MPRNRTVGLLLGNEVSFPAAFESFLTALAEPLASRLDLAVEVDRVRLGAFRADAPVPYDLVLDRVSHWHEFGREWLKTAALDGVYVINHPFLFQAHEKHAGFAAMARLGLDVPRTWLLPPADRSRLLEGAAASSLQPFALEDVGDDLGYPFFLKPFDGGGWIGVSRPQDADELALEYARSGRRIMNAQRAVEGDRFLRCVAVGPQVISIPYHPARPLHERYQVQPDLLTHEERARVEDTVRLIDAFGGLEWNSVELLLQGDRICPIDFWNGVPDASLAHLNYWFPEVLLAVVRWVLFCLSTGRRFRFSTRQARYLEIGREVSDPSARGAAHRELVDAYFETADFEDFSRHQLDFLEGAAHEFFSGDRFAAVLEEKVNRVYPPEEREDFTAYLGARVQDWLDGAG